MPVMDGFIARSLFEDYIGNNEGPLVYALTADESFETLSKVAKAKFHDCFNKLSDEVEIACVLNRIKERKPV